MKIVVAGSSNTDMILKVPRIPKPGETILGGTFYTAAGGKGANQAVAAARAGGEVTFIARIGDDMFGRQAREGFISDGITVDYVYTDETAPSGVALIFVDQQGENSIGVSSGANGALSSVDVSKAENAIHSADILLMQLEIPLDTVIRSAEIAHAAGVRVILNPAPACPLDDALLRMLTVITPNESEAEMLTGIPVTDIPGAEKAACALMARGVEIVIITLGNKGAYLRTGEQAEFVPGFPVEAVDTTAAGDVFNGSLAVSLAGGSSLVNAVRFANAAAALSVTQYGAQPSAPIREEIELFLRNY
jgi:ribokinase